MLMPKQRASGILPPLAHPLPPWIRRVEIEALQKPVAVENRRIDNYHRQARLLGIESRLPYFLPPQGDAQNPKEKIEREIRQRKYYVPQTLNLHLLEYNRPNPASTIHYEFLELNYVPVELHTLMRFTSLVRTKEIDRQVIALGSLLDCGHKRIFPILEEHSGVWVLDGIQPWTYGRDCPDFLYLVWSTP